MTNGELRRVLLLGPPGAGKGTLAPHLSELLGVPHVSSGQLLRASASEGDPHRIAEQVLRGHPVPDRVALQVVGAHLGPGFILDGFPRTVRQAAELDRLLEGDGRDVQLVLELVVPDEVASGAAGLAASLALSALALFLVGAGISLLTGRSLLQSGARMLLVGGLAASATFGIGRLIGVSAS